MPLIANTRKWLEGWDLLEVVTTPKVYSAGGMSETVRTSEAPTQLNSGCGQGQKLECSPWRLRRQGERIFFPDGRQQHEIFTSFQRIANCDFPGDQQTILEPVKPVVTCWNSFCLAFERAAKLQNAFNSYISYWCKKQKIADIHARSRSNKTPNAPSRMRSGGLTAADWQVVNEYILVLQPAEGGNKAA
jgi:hypothetical protein